MFWKLPKNMAISRRLLKFLNAHFRCFIVWGGEFEWPKIASKKRRKSSKWGQETSEFCYGDNLHRSWQTQKPWWQVDLPEWLPPSGLGEELSFCGGYNCPCHPDTKLRVVKFFVEVQMVLVNRTLKKCFHSYSCLLFCQDHSDFKYLLTTWTYVCLQILRAPYSRASV